MGMRMDGSTTYKRGDQGVFGSFFGQSSFSQHAIAYADNCIVVDKALDLPRLGPYGCGFQTGRRHDAQRRQPVGRRERRRVRRRLGRPVRDLGRADDRRRRRWPSTRWPAAASSPSRTARCTIDPTDLGGVTVVDKVKELTGGGANYGIDTTAIPEVVKAAQQSLAVRGTLIAIGLGAEEYPIDAVDLLQNGKIIQQLARGRRRPARSSSRGCSAWPTSSTSTG